MSSIIGKVDPEVAEVLHGERRRQTEMLEMIASENFASPAVLEATGSVLTNKYAEGYPGKRYYGGCKWADKVEVLAEQRAKRLFNAEHVNVQPHSGSQANMAAYFALLRVGDTIMGMDISSGGHLTHGLKANFSGRFFKAVCYGVRRDDHLIDYDRVHKLALEYRPKLIIAGWSAYPRIIDFATFAEIAKEVGAYFLADIAHFAGLVVTGHHPSPVPFADIVTSTTHKTLRGPRGGLILCRREYAQAIDRTVFPGTQGGPLMHIIAAKAIAFHEALQPGFKVYSAQIIANAKALADELLRLGFSLVSDGTDTHLLLIDLSNSELTGKAAQEALEKAGITVNKNAVPFDLRPPTETSGVRIGTPALTTRGMKENEMRLIARMISEILSEPENEAVTNRIRGQARELCQQFPIWGEGSVYYE